MLTSKISWTQKWVVLLILVSLFRLGISWTTVYRATTFYVDFNRYDLEIQAWGGNGDEFDLHFKTSSGDRHMEFDLKSYSSTLSMSSLCGSWTLRNVPVPSTSNRIWKFSKTSSYFYIHCDGRQIASIPRTSLPCVSSYDWQTLGAKGLYIDGTDDVSRYYRVSTGNRCTRTNGGWSSWAGWGSCSCDHSTGTGTWTRTRSCNNPSPSCGGSSCSGSSSDTDNCDSQCCRITNGGWSSWAGWGSCSCDHSTGTGTWTRTRSCNNPSPSCGGSSCSGSSSDTDNCDSQCCRITHGGWSNWAEWGTCDCDYNTNTATWTRARSCNNPSPSCGGNSCTGDSSQVGECVDQCSPRDGGWSSYGDWSACSAVCGGGTQTRTKTCTNPEPRFGGDNCFGEDTDTRDCNPYPCEEFVIVDRNGEEITDERQGLLLYSGGTVCDDNFSDNSANAICSELGHNFRAVSWTSGFIYPTFQASKTVTMNDVGCSSGIWLSCSPATSRFTCRHMEDIHLACELGTPVDGGWSSYGDWSACSAVCGGGTQTKTKTCTNPAPLYGGLGCVGMDTETRDCNVYSCGAFSLLNQDGRPVTGEEEGLLIFGGGTVCDDNFSVDPANAICKELGFGRASQWRSGVNWGSIQTSKPVLLDNVVCSSDGSWSSCTYSEISNCLHEEDVFMTCQDFTLVDENGSHLLGQKEGLLLYKAGTVCDNDFTNESANAVCRKMGYHAADSWRSGLENEAQQTDKGITLGSVSCSSGEWESCEVSAESNCSHDQDVYLQCYDFSIVDVDGNSVTDEQEGLLLYKGGTVCDDMFSDNTAHTICREMGYHGAYSWRSGMVYGSQQIDREVTLDDIKCESNDWTTCTSNKVSDCKHSEDVFISCELPTLKDGEWSSYGDWSACSAVCGGGTQTRTKTCTNPVPRYGGLDCVGEDTESKDCNPYPCNGFVIVDIDGIVTDDKEDGLLLFGGGTICDDDFNYKSANAICRELGFGAASLWRSGVSWGSVQTDKPISLNNVVCSEDGLWSSCRHSASHNCVHNEDVFLECQDFALINEFGHPIMTHQTEGVLLHKDGTVCSDGFSDMSAHAICRKLGYHAAASWRTGLVYGSQQSSRTVSLSKVTCSTDDWSSCFSNSTSVDEEIDHEEDVLLSCEYAPDCVDFNGKGYQVGQGYPDNVNPQKVCTCKEDSSFTCECPVNNLVCSGGSSKWSDDETCESKCVKDPGYCYSAGDPHYLTFDGKYYDFHGVCTYQAASCGDFTVHLKNVDLHGGPPRYTYRIELRFKGHEFTIGPQSTATVDSKSVQTPYVRKFSNGDKVEIIHNGQLEILLYSKNRSPAVRLQAVDASSYINANIWLHGSCAGITEGLCGNWNGNAADDLIRNDPNFHGEKYKEFDEHCQAPPPPYDPCKAIGPDARTHAEDICNSLTESPFSDCNNVVPVGDTKEGLFNTCMTDVCQCSLDKTCACPQFDAYAQRCIESRVDLNDWREAILFCPYDCPEGQLYRPNGAVPAPTCLERSPTKTGTVRGCFCSEGNFLQDGQCVRADECKCLHEGTFYNNGHEIRSEGECKVCTCEDSGEMTCADMTCPELHCEDDELISYREGVCCPYCLSDWVEAMNPSIRIKEGQSVTLTCAVHVKDVGMKSIVWYKDGDRVFDSYKLSINRLTLKIEDAGAKDRGTYTCQATKGGVAATGDFSVSVHIPAVCTHKDGASFLQGEIYNPNQNTQCTCDARGRHSCSCILDHPASIQCSFPTAGVWYDEHCNKTCVPVPGTCTSGNDPHYRTFDGKYYDFHGKCTYQAASCDDFKVKLKNKHLGGSPTYTDKMILEFKGHLFSVHSSGYSAHVNNRKVSVPYDKKFENGDRVAIRNNGQLVITLYSQGRDPSAELTARSMSGGRWINVVIKLHGSCASVTEGLCGVWNGNIADDLFKDSPNDNAEKFKDYDESCPPPPAPYDPCDNIGPLRKAKALAICQKLTELPFSACNNVVPVGDTNGGFINTCMTEVCQCHLDKSCACPEFDMYAEECINSGVDLSYWRDSVDFCPYTCPKGEVYLAEGPVPTPTCLDKNPSKTGTARGCFCPQGHFLQDDQCVEADQCKCLHEGIFYNNGDEIRDEGDCQVCTCGDTGIMSCLEMTCPELNCDGDELISYKDDECCPYCQRDWVEAVNPKTDLKEGQSVVLTCLIHAANVDRKKINWYKDGKRLREDISRDRLKLSIKDADSSDSAQYECEATKNGKTASSWFVVDVHVPILEALTLVKDPCEDKNKWCRIWAHKGFCNLPYCMRFCKSSCSLCDTN